MNRVGEICNKDEPCYFLHSDMLHESPGCIGIVHDPETVTAYGNVYWAFDATGNNKGTGQLVRFDFQQPHGPGSMDHSTAAVRRYPEVKLHRGSLEGVHAGMAIHPTRRELYIAATGDNKILVVNVDSGSYARTAREEYPIYSNKLPSFEYSIWECVEQRDFALDIDTPTGLALSPDGEKLFVAERGTGKILVYEIDSGILLYNIQTEFKTIGGMAFSPKSQTLHFVDDETNTVNAVKTLTACTNPIPSQVPTSFVETVTSARDAINWASDLDNNKAFSLYRNYNCSVDPIVPNSSFFDQVHVGTGYASDDPNVQSMAGMDETAALLANRTDCGRTSDLNFDALLLGGYYCHRCLPYGGAECDTGGKCTNVQWNGYTCDNEYLLTEIGGTKVSLQKSDGTLLSSTESSWSFSRKSSMSSLVLSENVTYRFTVRGNMEVCARAVAAKNMIGTTVLCARDGPLLLKGGPDLPQKLVLHAQLPNRNFDVADITVEEGRPISFAIDFKPKDKDTLLNRKGEGSNDRGLESGSIRLSGRLTPSILSGLVIIGALLL